MPKAIFFDVDNTLLEEKYHKLVPSSVVALKRLKKAGFLIFLATSRSICEIDIFKGEVEFDGMVLSNGGAVYCGNKLIKQYRLSENEVATIIEFIKQNPDFNVTYTFDNESVNIMSKAIHRDYIWFEMNNLPIRERTLKTTDQPFQLFLRGLIDYNDPLIKSLNNCDFNAHFPYYTAVLPQKTNKAKGAIQLIEHLGLSVSDCACVGDSMNDYEIFQTITESYCIGNGHEKLKLIAHEVIGTIDEDPIYKLCLNKGWIAD